MKRGEIYRSRVKNPQRGNKPGFYVVVSRDFIAENSDISTVICAPIYSQILSLRSELVLGPEDGLPRHSAVRCDFLMLMFKRKLTTFVTALSDSQIQKLNKALQYALELDK